jgi:hypothetical protein
MVASEPPNTGLPETFASPASWMALWSRTMGEAAGASVNAWSTFAELQRQALASYGAMFGAAIGSDRVALLEASESVDEALAEELSLVEGAADHLAHFGEDAIADETGGPIFSLPD